jgi:hypothetical protein
MGIRRRIAVAISSLAFAGITALTLGAAAPADAQAITTARQHLVVAQGCDWGWSDCSGWHHYHHWHHWHHY